MPLRPAGPFQKQFQFPPFNGPVGPFNGICPDGLRQFLFMPQQIVIAEQLRIAGGEPISVKQEEIQLSGHAIEFKNRWFQPFVCLLPAYLVLRFGGHVLARPRMQNLALVMTGAIMLVLLGAMAVRPLAGQWRGKYCWLNMPYDQLATEIQNQLKTNPEIVVTPDMRLGGNLRVSLPDSTIMSHDTESSLPEELEGAKGLVVLVTESQSPDQRNSFLKKVAPDAVEADLNLPWVRIELPMRYSSDGAKATYYFRTLRSTDTTRIAERTQTSY